MPSTNSVPLLVAWASTFCTGVAKSRTSIGRCRAAGNCALPMSTTTREPVVRRSGAAPLPEKRRISLPEPPSPRLKSIADTVTASGVRLAGSANAPVAACPMPVVKATAGNAPAPAAYRPTAMPAASTPKGWRRRAGSVCLALVTVIGLFPNQFASRDSLAGRSSQPPAPSGTSSTRSIRSSCTAVTRPSLCPM